MLSMLFRKVRGMPFVRDRDSHTDILDRIARQSSVRDKFRFIQETDRTGRIK